MFPSQEIQTPRSRFLRLSASLLPWIGGALLVLAAVSAANTWWTFKSWFRTEAVVTENSASQDAKGDVLYVTHLRFRLPSGQMVTFIDPSTSTDPDDPALPTAAVTAVVYPAGHPESARIGSISRLYKTAIILGVLGVVFFDIGIIFRLRLKRRPANAVKPPRA
jgi:hypothetical protein